MERNIWGIIPKYFIKQTKNKKEMKAKKIEIKDNRIYLETENGEKVWQSLLWYPILMKATEAQRESYRFTADGIHWEEIDEDISYESFNFKQKEPKGVAKVFKEHPELKIAEIARKLGIQRSLLAAYISGAKIPSKEREKLILDCIRNIGKELAMV